MDQPRNETRETPPTPVTTLPGGITPEQPPMDDAAGGPQADESDD